MNRLRSILLSGLVALLMVGFVQAGDVNNLEATNEVDAGIGIYFGTWNSDHTICESTGGSDCLRIWISFDLTPLKNLFN